MIRDDIAAIVKEHAIVLCGEGWHHGTIGIVAARLAEKYNLPTVLLTRECGKAKGSARSVGDFNIYQALAKASEGIACCGGHEKAAGIKMLEENFPAFKAAFTAITREALGEGIRNPRLALDLELRPEERASRRSIPFRGSSPTNRQPDPLLPSRYRKPRSPAGRGKATL